MVRNAAIGCLHRFAAKDEFIEINLELIAARAVMASSF
jgi:hypothetical protein